MKKINTLLLSLTFLLTLVGCDKETNNTSETPDVTTTESFDTTKIESPETTEIISIAYAAIFPIFLFLPFIIGHFASYEKIHFYTNIQILTLIISLLLALSFI